LNILLGQLFHNSSKPLRRITYDVSSSEEEGVSSEEKIICSVIELYRFLVYKIPTATKRILMRLIPSTSTRDTVNRRTLVPMASTSRSKDSSWTLAQGADKVSAAPACLPHATVVHGRLHETPAPL
jgi:hypothetical protein